MVTPDTSLFREFPYSLNSYATGLYIMLMELDIMSSMFALPNYLPTRKKNILFGFKCLLSSCVPSNCWLLVSEGYFRSLVVLSLLLNL